MELATQANRMMRITTPLGEDYLLINKLSATEALSTLFSFEVELLHDEGDSSGHEPTIIEIEKILGQTVEITVTQRDDTTRTFHGIVNQFSQGNRDGRFTYYYATVVPAVWILTQRSQSRIFQQMSVPEILQDVLAEFDVQYEQQGTFKARNYCVQYRETDFAFISRLMEEEGLYYYFKHGDKTHQMIVGNMSQSNHDCPSKNEIHWFLKVSDVEDWVSSIGTWRVDYRLQTGKVTFWDYNFQLPKKNLEGTEPTSVKIGGNDNLEFYDYPGGYARKYDGIDKGGGDNPADLSNIDEDKEKTVKTRMQELDAQYRAISGIADCCSLTAGHRFKLLNHPQSDFNTQYVLTSVTHEIEQSPDYETEEEISRSYGNSFSCIQYTIPYRPEQVTPKPVVRGSQTAVVVGPAGEEIFTDKYGRVKVQFYWDREGQANESSSCWMRVSQPWAGRNWGTICIPRIGQEVIIDFIEGDPDQPIITGSVYNAEQMPPYELPNNAHTMGFKSNSTKGGGGYNEIVIIDDKTNEMVRIHAQKDMDTTVRNNRKTTIINDDSLTIKKGSRTQVIEKGGDSLEIKIGGRETKIPNGQDKLKAKTIQYTATEKIELICGGSSITMEPGKITIVSPVVEVTGAPIKLNC